MNLELVEVNQIEAAADKDELKSLIEVHTKLTGSVVGRKILDNWDEQVKLFKKVIPTMFRLAMERRAADHGASEPAGAT